MIREAAVNAWRRRIVRASRLSVSRICPLQGCAGCRMKVITHSRVACSSLFQFLCFSSFSPSYCHCLTLSPHYRHHRTILHLHSPLASPAPTPTALPPFPFQTPSPSLNPSPPQPSIITTLSAILSSPCSPLSFEEFQVGNWGETLMIGSTG